MNSVHHSFLWSSKAPSIELIIKRAMQTRFIDRFSFFLSSLQDFPLDKDLSDLL